MSTEENKAIVIRHIKEVLEQGRVELIDSYYAPDGTEAEMDTPAQWRERVLWHHKTCPGFKIEILDMMAEGDKVMVQIRADLTYSVPEEEPLSFPFPPPGKPVSWRNMDVYRIVNGKMVSEQSVTGWFEMLVKIGELPFEKVIQNKTAVRRFVDALNRQDTALLAEVCTPDVAKNWTNMLPEAYATFKDHHIELVDMVADGEAVAVKMATSGYHTGEHFGIPATGKWWTNNGNCIFHFDNGKISETDFVFNDENLIKQLGGTIQPAAA